MTAYNRLDYLTQTMEALEEAIAYVEEPVFLVARVEPSKVAEHVAAGIGSGMRGRYVTVNDKRLGLGENTYAALTDAWAVADRMEEDFVLHLEDDFVVSPDALRLAAFMRDYYREARDVEYVGLGGTREATDWEAPNIRYCVKFSCAGWGTWREHWENVMRPNWPHADGLVKEGVRSEWAFSVDKYGMMTKQAVPVLGRITHIGIEGTHSTQKFYDKGWATRPMMRDVYTGPYVPEAIREDAP